jgi:3-dehydroquinate synthase
VAAMAELVHHNVAIKARVVMVDPLEKGERAHLNFGHTFAHAFENVSQFAYSHGEAVALGMVAASRMARLLGMIDQASVIRIEEVIASAGLPTGGLKLDSEACAAAMAFDKKVAGRKIRFVLPDRIGSVVIRDDVPHEQVLAAVESLRG